MELRQLKRIVDRKTEDGTVPDYRLVGFLCLCTFQTLLLNLTKAVNTVNVTISVIIVTFVL